MTGNKKVILTGITGFIGSNIARELIRRNYTVCGLRRNYSSLHRILDIADSINWINVDDEYWAEILKKDNYDILIHSAWNGISEKERNNWNLQLGNFEFSKCIFDVAALCGVKKIISFGSQAEYGIFQKIKVSENFIPSPIDAYGSIKLLTMHYLRNLSVKTSLEWYWIRIFSVFGKGENEGWLIPNVINKLKNNESIDLTEGKQIYDYLHSDDLVENLMKVINCESDKSGIYNLCSGVGIEIRELIKNIALLFPGSEALLNFGRIPYRPNQNMYSVGNKDKFESAFGKIKKQKIKNSIFKTVNYYL